jgi:muramoyltetrapeptide carboxypeptidase LdcA involved in peptidoglycan recycling
MEILPLLDWEKLKAAAPKWVLGYSDVSTFLLAYTLLTGNASAHGTNYIDLCALEVDATTEKWVDVLGTAAGGVVRQVASERYQSAWKRGGMLDGFDLDTKTVWKCLGMEETPEVEVRFGGRLLGGCLETIFALIGTGFAPVEEFVERYCKEDGVVWYFESTNSNPADIYRKLWMMKFNGWFNHVKGVVFGRLDNYTELDDFEFRDALSGIFGEMGIPVVYEADIGHVPPQVTLVNGAVVEVRVVDGKGEVVQEFR